MRNLKNARVMMIVSMVTFGTLGLFVRHISVSSGELALYRAVLATVLLGVWFLLTGQRLDFRAIGRELPLLLLSGVAMGFNWILLFEAYKYTSVSVATLSYYFAPVIVTLVCPILFHERLTPKQLVCFALSTLGIILITGLSGAGQSGTDLIGIGFGLGAAVLYALVVLINKFIKGVEGLHRTFLQFVAALVVLLPYVAFAGGFHLASLDGTGWICLLIVGFIHTGVAYCMYFPSLKELPGQKAAILSYIDPLVAVLVSVFLLEESLTLPQAVGGLLILGFTLWNELESSKK